MEFKQQLVFFRAFDVHVVLPPRLFCVEVDVQFLVVVNSELHIVARWVGEEIEAWFKHTLFVLENKHSLWGDACRVEGVSAAGIVVAEIHY